MVKKIYILTILITGLFFQDSFGQGSAQATMRVSVEVVEGASVAMSQPDKVNLSEDGNPILGAMRMQGSDNTLVSVSDQLQLFNSSGSQINLDIIASKDMEENANEIRFQGLKTLNNTERGSYTGELKATIEYL
ncbi:hypothetical protein [Fodinibius sp. AD559]|uniref:hypothetical protein n=1 Tax=Fodinibius sp. AD559 TaxID=3424179 RepID=UPI0040470132